MAEGCAAVKKYDEALESIKKCIAVKEKADAKDTSLQLYRQKEYQWRVARKEHQRQSKEKTKGFFHKYWDLKEKEE